MNTLQALRKEIDRLDEALLRMLADRRGLVRKAGKYKEEKGMPYWQDERVKEILKTRTEWGKALGLNEKFVSHLFDDIINFSMEEEEGKHTEQ